MEGEEEEEESEGTLTEVQSMSPLHLEEEAPVEGIKLMRSILEEQPILPPAVSGQCCICSTGSLPLSKYHPYVWSSYFKGRLHGLLSSEAFCSCYL